MYLIFDLETTGLVQCEKFNHYPDFKINEPYDTARIIQFAWVILDENFRLIEERNYYIKRDNFMIPESEYHHVTNEISDRKGVQFNIVVQDFLIALNKCFMIVSHNILADFNVLANHLYRFEHHDVLNCFISKSRFCTSIEATHIVKIPLYHDSTQYKYPKLSELYYYYFKTPLDNHHDALADTLACADCFIMIMRDFHLIKKTNQI